MANFLFVYYGGKMETDPKKAQETIAVWTKWFKDLGKAVVDAGNPTKPGKTISKSGVKNGFIGEAVTGYSILKADSLDSAAAIAKSCPQIAAGGQIAVYEIMPMM